jgi:hypothetical protein
MMNFVQRRAALMGKYATAILASAYLLACGSTPEPGPQPKPPWPDSPAPPSYDNATPRQSNPNSRVPPPSRRKVDLAITALSDVWVLVKPEGQEELWKNLRKGERLVIPKTGPMAITYSSGKNIKIEAGGRVIKHSGGNEGVGFIDLK